MRTKGIEREVRGGVSMTTESLQMGTPDSRARSAKTPCLRPAVTGVLLLAIVLAALLGLPGQAKASFIYSIPKQQDQLTIEKDGSVTLVRYFEFRVEQGSTDSGTEIWAGLPTAGTKVSGVVDEDGLTVKSTTRSSGGEYVVALTGFSIRPGTTKGFTITAMVPDFVHRDTVNEGYVTVQYTPGWWTSKVAVQDVAVILPLEVEKSEIKTGSRAWDGIAQIPSGAYVVTWQFKDLSAGERVSINIGIPDKHVTLPSKTETPPVPLPTPLPNRPSPRVSTDPGSAALFGIFIVAAAVMVGIAALNSQRGREEYESPQISMEGVGVNETLLPVEASILLRQPPEKTLTLLLFSLVKKGALRVSSHEPLRVSVDSETNLNEAERLFIDSIDRATGEIDGRKLLPCFRHLTTSVNEKMKPYCRRDTEAFYRGVILRMWDDVSRADTPELKLSSIDRNLLWLILDEERMKDAEDEFPRDRPVDALPNWWILGFMFNRPFGYPYYLWPGALYGQYTGIYGGLVGEDERKSMRAITEEVWTPARPPGRSIFGGGSGRGSSHGGFTPPSCACACACVSCACACACAGGGGCT